MEKVDIFDQEVGRAAIECNGNYWSASPHSSVTG